MMTVCKYLPMICKFMMTEIFHQLIFYCSCKTYSKMYNNNLLSLLLLDYMWFQADHSFWITSLETNITEMLILSPSASLVVYNYLSRCRNLQDCPHSELTFLLILPLFLFCLFNHVWERLFHTTFFLLCFL